MDTTELIRLQKILSNHPNRVAVIIVATPNFSRNFKLTKHKFLISKQNTIGLFMFHFKRSNNIQTDKSIYLYHQDTLLNLGHTFEHLKEIYKHEIVLTLTVDCENVFG